MIQIGIISLFPKMFRAIIDYGITGRAIKNGFIWIQCWNPRTFTKDKNHIVDDRPYGGGPGMLMLAQPLRDAIYQAKKELGRGTSVIYLSPQGNKLDQESVSKLATKSKIILVCGRYEGIDERLINMEVDEEWSMGDYVLSGGELAAMVLIDAISRFIPGVLGNKFSVTKESFANGLLDHPQFTRPQIIDGMEVPSVLLSGNHKKIHLWRMKQSLGRTWLRRPDLLKKLVLTKEQLMLLTEFQLEYTKHNIK